MAGRQWIEEVDQAPRMEAVGALLIEFCERRSLRGMLYVDYFGTSMVWRGTGPQELKAALAHLVDFRAPSIFNTAALTRKEAAFVPPGTAADQKFFAGLPEMPADARAFPIFAPRQQRILLYVDAGPDRLTEDDHAALLSLCAAATNAYARITALAD